MNSPSFENYTHFWSNPIASELYVKFKSFLVSADTDIALKAGLLLKSYLSNKINVLEIGPGEGTISMSFLKSLSPEVEVISYTGLELSHELIKIFQSKMNFSLNINNFSVKEIDANNFQSDKLFNLIFSINAWYGLSFNKILDYRAMLANNGILAILLNSQDSITIKLTTNFDKKVLGSEDLIRWLNEEKIPYDKYHLESSIVPKQNFFNKSSEGFYRYLLRKPQGDISDVYTFLESQSDDLFKFPADLILIKANN